MYVFKYSEVLLRLQVEGREGGPPGGEQGHQRNREALLFAYLYIFTFAHFLA